MQNTGRKPYKKIAVVLSLCAMLLWLAMGTGASLAWFRDTSPTVKNVFNFGELKLEVSHRTATGDYEPVDADVAIFDDKALYEPGYVQVAYLKVKNVGTVPFDLQAAVNVTSYTTATNVFGGTFQLQEYLLFGLISAPTEQEMMTQLADRSKARAVADTPLNTYEAELPSLNAGQELYVALVIAMPESVGNVANYRGNVIPTVELGVIITANQQHD